MERTRQSAGQCCVEHGLGDRSGELAAGARRDLGVGAFDDHGDGVLRVVGGSEGDGPGMRLLRLALLVELGGARLGGDGDPALEGDATARRAFGGDELHQVGEGLAPCAAEIGSFHTSGSVRSSTRPE